MKILMVSTEYLPFAKIGGLADVKILIPRCRGIAPELLPRRSDPITVRTGQGPAVCGADRFQ